jgi:wyosine [tRNA(Phe)-imidazoG37] synthetase (radical SAM superfamily)
MKRPSFRYVFGPVPSRRLGRSLGVDLVPFKTCTYDCIYCQLGRTTNKTVRRRQFVPLNSVLSELKAALATGPCPDFVTLAGSGEPTLHSGVKELIPAIKQLTKVPVAVLTNGSLLWDRRVRATLAEADVVIPSLDAGDEALFRYVNRPHPSLSFRKMTAGIEAFAREFPGRLWLEVFLLGGVTGLEAGVAKIAAAARRIDPERVQLNTIARPPAETFALPLSRERLEHFTHMFDVPTEVVADYRGAEVHTEAKARAAAILGLLLRRPCTTGDIAVGLGLNVNEVLKCLVVLMRRNAVVSEMVRGTVCYRARTVRAGNGARNHAH